jgi:hypothetical protein
MGSVPAESKAVEQAAEELYGLPPGEFTKARDQRQRALRKEGLRNEADAVKALRKPTVAAWALNQLPRRRGKEVERLLAAGERLRAAQEELLAGGDRSAFQRAAATERDLVAKLAAEAVQVAAEGGEHAGPGLQEKVAETLHAAALDEDTAAELRAGRLVREREAIGGFGAAASVASDGGSSGGSKGRADAKRTEGHPKRTAAGMKRAASAGDEKRATPKGDARKADAEAAKRRKADEEAARLRQRLAGARTDERHARRELEAAARATEQAETRAEAAETHASEAARRAQLTAERLTEARRAEAAARKAHARAERALAKLSQPAG